MPNTELSTLFTSLSDEELMERAGSGGLTEEAQALADAEVSLRGLQLPLLAAVEPAMAYQGDLTIVARNLSATEAQLLCACLLASGVPAETADTQLVQTNALLTIAVGGASVRVPANFVAEARAVIAAFERGDFALDENFNPS
jgi:hypothetical protein